MLSCVRFFATPRTVALCLWNSPGKNTGVDCYLLLQGTFLTQGLNPGLLHCRGILYCLSYREVPLPFEKWSEVKLLSCVWLFATPVDCSLPGSSVHGLLQSRVLEWVAISFSRGASDPGIKPGSPVLQADALPSEPAGSYHLSYSKLRFGMVIYSFTVSWMSHIFTCPNCPQQTQSFFSFPTVVHSVF